MSIFRFILNHEGAIYLLSALISLVFALVMFSLLKSARILQNKKWVKPFADFFLVLAGIYLLRLTRYIYHINTRDNPLNLINIAMHFGSGLTNYLFFLSGFRLLEPALDKRQLPRLKKWVIGWTHVRGVSFTILCIASLMGLAGGWTRLPDTIFSAMALLFMGFVLYQNSSFRRDKLMSWVALLSAIGYAVLYLLLGFGLIHYLIIVNLPDASDTDIRKMSALFMSLVSLLLKFGFFFSAYSLMMLISGPVQGIERLLKNVTRNQEEYLESDGIVRSICEELHVSSVRVYIKLPGSNENKVALYAYPSTNDDDKQEPQELTYKQGEVYDLVIKSRRTYIHNPERRLHWIVPRLAKVGVPVFFHNTVIACLEVVIGKEKFTGADRSNLERIATLISPAVQFYRERDGLTRISQKTAQLQIGVVAYDIERDVKGITEIIHDILSSLATGISIEVGFSEYRSVYSQDDLFEELLQKQLDAEPDEKDNRASEKNYHWLKKGLKISMVNSQGQKIGEQVFGKFIFAADEDVEKVHSTLGTNALFLRDISNLVTDRLLDFIRGYLTALTDKLGVRLSGLKGTSAKDWLNEVEKTAQEARLLWAVASYPDDDELLGDDENVRLVNRLESEQHKGRWEEKDSGLWLYSLDQPEAEACHVIKKHLKETGAIIWLGVERCGFGREMDYVSPWKYFLDHFCEIADSALLRIMSKKHDEELRKHMAEFLIMETSVTSSVIHRLANLSESLIGPLTALEEAVKTNRLQCDEALKPLILCLLNKRDDFQELINLFLDARKRDEQRPCQLDEAITHAFEKIGDSLEANGIRVIIEKRTPKEAFINVSLHAATNAFVNVFENSRDALVCGKANNGNGNNGNGNNGKVHDRLIRIVMEDEGDKFTCYITDNGPGVPPDVQKKLFKQVIKTTKTNGHGMGLYYSAFWLRGYGGDILHVRQEPKQGATFSIHFPK